MTPISVTDRRSPGGTDWQSTLQLVAKSSGHELRNALNGLVVNLEVVRATAAAAGLSAEPFMGQALAQSEESIRLAESAIALVSILSAAIGNTKLDVLGVAGERSVTLPAGDSAERLASALAPLVERRLLSVETHGPTVILRIPQDRYESTENE